ncbi:rod-binding protein [Oceanicella sp. SM1341]|uniref:rod-binding protein n=1 Tax=Oceanicella sp. SM1341 TaxID=1548889 RepID=UPI000E51BFE5|nr:rod-binding protein [Oceanicella sp. SM1341]
MTSPILTAPAAVPGLLPGRTAPLPDLPGGAGDRQARLHQLAQELEAGFLTEMLKSAGVGKARENFGGGAGEEAFSSLLLREQAGLLAARGGVGLAEHIYRSLVAREGAGDV